MVSRCDVLAIGAHPDDVELGCGGLVARLVASGKTVGVVDLTAGELGTRGEVEVRRAEAAAAASALGVSWRQCLALPDGGLRSADPEQMAAVVGVLRTAGPRVVILPDGGDPHPDHQAAAALVARACTWSAVRSWRPTSGPPHKPQLLLAYPGPRQVLAPAVVVEVTAWYPAKRSACLAHRSQFDPEAGPPTHLASGHFLAAIEGRDRAVGNTVGVALAEGFSVLGPLPGDELAWLLRAGEREPGTGEQESAGAAVAVRRFL